MHKEETPINFIGHYPSTKAKLHLEKLLHYVETRLNEEARDEGTEVKMTYYNSTEGPQTCTLKIKSRKNPAMFTRAGANAFEVTPQLYRDVDGYFRKATTNSSNTKNPHLKENRHDIRIP